MISILDYGMGNLGSLTSMFNRIGTQTNVISEPNQVRNATKLVLPGVGSFDRAMSSMNSVAGLRDALEFVAHDKKIPILGVCLGMQLMFSSSAEGGEPGLAWIKGGVYKFDTSSKIRVPHMGWNSCVITGKKLLLEGISSGTRFYFAHSYYAKVEEEANSVMQTNHGVVFDSAVNVENILGVQFHPEKSLKNGMRILTNFSEM